MPPQSFEDHLREHPKDQSPAPGREERRPKIIFDPAKVAQPMTRMDLKGILADLEAAEMGVKTAAKEVSKVRVRVRVKTGSTNIFGF